MKTSPESDVELVPGDEKKFLTAGELEIVTRFSRRVSVFETVMGEANYAGRDEILSALNFARRLMKARKLLSQKE